MKILCGSEGVTYLVHNIKKLEEYRCEATRLIGYSLTAAMGEAMAERQPLLLYEYVQTVNRAVEGIHHYLSNRHNLHKETKINNICDILKTAVCYTRQSTAWC